MNEYLNTLYQYIKDHELLSDEEIEILKTCNNEIIQASPTDRPQLFRKEERLIECSHKLSWCIYSINRKLTKVTEEYKRKKDPGYTMLVRQQRPSGAAIDAELRFKDEELYEYDKYIETIRNILEYLKHIEQSIERYLYMLRDKLKYDT